MPSWHIRRERPYFLTVEFQIGDSQTENLSEGGLTDCPWRHSSGDPTNRLPAASIIFQLACIAFRVFPHIEASTRQKYPQLTVLSQQIGSSAGKPLQHHRRATRERLGPLKRGEKAGAVARNSAKGQTIGLGETNSWLTTRKKGAACRPTIHWLTSSGGGVVDGGGRGRGHQSRRGAAVSKTAGTPCRPSPRCNRRLHAAPPS